MAGLGHVLESLVQACTPTRDDYDKRAALIRRIEKVLQRIGHVENLRVIPYGSFVSQFYNSTSDLDLAICGTIPAYRLKPASRAEIYGGAAEEEDVSVHKLDRRTKTQLLRDVGFRLLAEGLACRGALEFILHARVPIVKFVDPDSGIEVDLCLGNDATAFKAWSVAQVASIHPAFGKLFRVVKVWAKAHSINDGASHMLNSWCLTLVVISFLQTYPDPPLLPPLHALLYDGVPDLATPRLMQSGRELPPEVYDIMEYRAKHAQELYGSRPCKPVEELFRDFVEDGARKLRSLLAREDSFRRGTRVSAFYGKMLTARPFPSSYVLCVEDPYDDTDNTARTLGTWEGHPGTIHYITSVFERTLRHLNTHIGTATIAAAAAAAPGPSGSNTPSSDAQAGAASSPASCAASSLASTLVFLFGTELLTRLPDLSARVLGPGLCKWAQGALAAGRPVGEVHEELLRRLRAVGDDSEFVSFDSFKRRHGIRVHNEAKYATPEEKAAAVAVEAARKATKKARDAERRAAKKTKEAADEVRSATRAGREAAERASGAQQQQQQQQKASTEQGDGGDERAAAAAAAVTVALGGKQAPAAGAPTPPQPPCKERRSTAEGSSEGPSHSPLQTTAPLPPAPSSRRPQHPPPPPPQQQPQQQPRARLTATAKAALGKALRSRRTEEPGPGSGSGPGTVPGLGPAEERAASGRFSADGAASAAAAAALRRGASNMGGAVRDGAASTSGREAEETSVVTAATAAAAAAAAAGAGSGSTGFQRPQGSEGRQSLEGPPGRQELKGAEEQGLQDSIRMEDRGASADHTAVLANRRRRHLTSKERRAERWRRQQLAAGGTPTGGEAGGDGRDGGAVPVGVPRADRRRSMRQSGQASAGCDDVSPAGDRSVGNQN